MVDEVEVRQKRDLVVLAVDMLVVCWWGTKPQFAIPCVPPAALWEEGTALRKSIVKYARSS